MKVNITATVLLIFLLYLEYSANISGLCPIVLSLSVMLKMLIVMLVVIFFKTLLTHKILDPTLSDANFTSISQVLVSVTCVLLMLGI
jgi:phosphoglycerol transferase MdoB-like AlkP superfamily enzyme